MDSFLAITIDCECDKGPGWRVRQPLSFRSVTEGICAVLHPLFRRYNAAPTYLLSAEVLKDAASLDVLSRLEPALELGTHLHGEFCSFLENGSCVPASTSAYMQDESLDVLREQVGVITDLFHRAFGRAPRSFRAGRFGADARTLAVLEEFGYTVDTSVLPGLVEATAGGSIDFSMAPTYPYRPDPSNLAARGAARVVEVPVSVCRHPWKSMLCPRVTEHNAAGFRARLCKRLLPSVALRPTFHSFGQLKSCASRLLAAAGPGDPVVLNMMFHNVEFVPGMSPYALDPASVGVLLDRLDSFLAWWRERGGRFATLEQVSALVP